MLTSEYEDLSANIFFKSLLFVSWPDLFPSKLPNIECPERCEWQTYDIVKAARNRVDKY